MEDDCPIIVRELPHEAVDFLFQGPDQSFFLTILAGSSCPFLINFIEIELTQWRVFLAVIRSPSNT